MNSPDSSSGFDSPDHPGESYVHFLGVRPDQRGSGLGRELHDRFAREAAARGVTTVRCVTSTVNTASVAFHTTIGFEWRASTSRRGRRASTTPPARPHGPPPLTRRHPSPLRRLDDAGGASAVRRGPKASPRRGRHRPSRASVGECERASGSSRARTLGPRTCTGRSSQWPPHAGTHLRGTWVELMPTTQHDAHALRVAIDHDHVWQHQAGGPLPDDATARHWITDVLDRGWFPWTVRLLRDVGERHAGTVVGWSSYLDIVPGRRPARDRLNTGYDPAVWRTASTPRPSCCCSGTRSTTSAWARRSSRPTSATTARRRRSPGSGRPVRRSAAPPQPAPRRAVARHRDVTRSVGRGPAVR